MSMGDTDWRHPVGERRITKPTPIEYYDLREYDGGEGTMNPSTGYIVSKRELAEEWAKSAPGRSYNTLKGVHIGKLEDMPAAAEILARQKALAKLTDEDKKALGLA